MKLRLLPFILTSILVGAHFLRGGYLMLSLVSIAIPLILLIKKPWILILAQLYAFFGAGIWLSTLIEIAKARMLMGEDWMRMAIILGVVSGFSVWSGVLLNSAKVKEKYS